MDIDLFLIALLPHEELEKGDVRVIDGKDERDYASNNSLYNRKCLNGGRSQCMIQGCVEKGLNEIGCVR